MIAHKSFYNRLITAMFHINQHQSSLSEGKTIESKLIRVEISL